jgi:ubiquinone/menaquinone biosynthesis C-methylase UbiE
VRLPVRHCPHLRRRVDDRHVRPLECGVVDAADPREHKEAIASVFSRTSATHDTVGTPLFGHFGQMLVDRAELEAGERVLDVAAGTGATLFPAARRVGHSGRVVGIDLAPGMVDRLRAGIAARGISNTEVRLADAEELPFVDESFDVVLCGFGLFFFPDAAATALREFRRVLRDGGRLAVSTFTKEGSASFDRIWQQISAHIEGPPPPPENHVRFDGPRQLHEALQSAGFVGIDVVESPLEIGLPDFEAWWAWIWSMEFREYLERMETMTLEHFRHSAAADLATQAGAPEIRIRMDALLTRAWRPYAATPRRAREHQVPR